MNKLKLFLKALKDNGGYPNPETLEISDVYGYDLEYFLSDLKKEIGEQGLLDFCDKAIEKLSGKEGIRIDLDGPNGDEYVYIKIYPIAYDEDESENDVICNHYWGDSRILYTFYEEDYLGVEKYSKIEDIIDSVDMSNSSNLDEMIDYIRYKAYNLIYENCGFGIWWN